MGQASLGVHLIVCVVCYAAKDWLRVTWKDLCRVYEFVEMVRFINLLLCYQHFMLMEYLHI